jgi:hypothetical protein
MRRGAKMAVALLIIATPALGETDTPVTLDRRVGPEIAEEMRIYVADPGDGPLHLDATV